MAVCLKADEGKHRAETRPTEKVSFSQDKVHL